MPFILVIALLILVSFSFVWLSFQLIPLLLMLLMAGFIGWLADLIVPGRIPYGWLGSIVAGLLGSLLGAMLLGPMGPRIFGLHFIPALVGTIVLAGAVQLVGKLMAPRYPQRL
jgi:uncharacterized membrane protein YeaQ/YmgE (transglycosylase-associated protein family)